jgi:hypothetical protein
VTFAFADCELDRELFQLRRRGRVIKLEPKLSVFPLACYGIGSFLSLRFGLDRAAHAQVQREIAATRSCVAAA